MTRSMYFIVDNPIPQPRQRHAVKKGKIVNYTPKAHKVTDFKQEAAARALVARPKNWPLDKAYSMLLVFHLKCKQNPGKPHISKPDLDNLEKSIMDSLKDIVYNDDCQVFRKTSLKRASELSYVEVTIEYLDE